MIANSESLLAKTCVYFMRVLPIFSIYFRSKKVDSLVILSLTSQTDS